MRKIKSSRTGPTASLHTVPVGSAVVLGELAVPSDHRLRLAELGLRSGNTVRVLAVTAGGGRIVGIGAGRLAVDRWVSQQISVTIAGRVAG